MMKHQTNRKLMRLRNFHKHNSLTIYIGIPLYYLNNMYSRFAIESYSPTSFFSVGVRAERWDKTESVAETIGRGQNVYI